MSESTGVTRVAVSALGETIDDRVDEHFGRAMYFIITGGQAGLRVIDNSVNRNALQGAGIASAELVSGEGATAVITGHLGPKAFDALAVAGLKGYDGTGLTVREALERFAASELSELTASSETHAG